MRKLAWLFALCLVAVIGTRVWAQDYSVTLIPTLGGRLTRAFAINQSGQITGSSDTATYPHAFLYSRTGGMLDLGTLGAMSSNGYAINGDGNIAGYGYVCACQPVAFWWSASTGMRKITRSGWLSGIASGINDQGQVVGSFISGPVTNEIAKGFFWSKLTGIQDLNNQGCKGCLPNAINNSSQLVGAIQLTDGSQHAFVWVKGGPVKDLGTLGGKNSSARAINRSGQIVGISDVVGGAQHGFYWSESSGMVDLGTLPGELNSWANGIDDTGRVVGTSWNPGKVPGLPFLWTESGGMKQLGPFTQNNISSADGINVAGQILVSAYRSTGYSSYVMTPIMHTSLTSSLNPSHPGDSVTFTATVVSTVQGPPPDGEMVKLMSGTAVLATSPVHSGVATFVLTLKGTRTLRAVYVGDLNYAPSKSPSLIQTVE